MSARLRIELFPTSLSESIQFYTQILQFTLVRHEPDPSPSQNSNHTSNSATCSDTGYAHLSRSTIQLGLSTKPPSEYPSAATDPSSRARFRRWPTGVELVMEVDDVDGEMRRVVDKGWPLDSGMVLQAWGLRDFRVVDPDGYFWRISERGGDDGRAEGTGKGGEEEDK